ncbi:MAG: Gfo/Idh/MocA family oxidoreductase [Anaerolineae bacterium]|nr:Gfo/Idh/MocA family oxidoreductase [Anaerolineae bacterium]
MEKEVTVALVGLGGYGNFYLRSLFQGAAEHNMRLVAGIDPNPIACQHLADLESAHIPIYPDLQHFYADNTADLVMVVAPIHLHLPFTLTALEHGSHVLCEKPLTGTIQDAYRMLEAADKSPNFVAIGYQWSFARAIQNLKQDVLSGVLGRPLCLRTKVLWPRAASYYVRNGWAAKLKASNGTWILDSPAQNATAHYLHNCFYILGETRETSAWPVDVQAELYRANPIENYDTAAIRCHTADGAEILFYTAHPVPNNIGPVLRYEFEHAVVEYMHRGDQFVARFHDGRVKSYGNPYNDDTDKLWQAADAVRQGRDAAPPACGVLATIPHILCINGAQESMWDIATFPPDIIRRRHEVETGDTLTWVDGLQTALETSYDQGKLPSEVGIPWAKSGKVVNLEDYKWFPSSEQRI